MTPSPEARLNAERKPMIRAVGYAVLTIAIMALLFVSFRPTHPGGSAPAGPPAALRAPRSIAERDLSPGTSLISTEESSARSAVASSGSDPSPETTTILPVDEAGQALGGVEVFMRTSSAWASKGTTEEAGSIEVNLEDTDSVDIVARSPGHVSCRYTSEPPHPSIIRLVLEPGGRICGQVLTPKGVAPQADVRVMAVPRFEALETADLLVMLQDGDPSLVTAAVDDDGSYCVEGLRPSQLYSLMCGGAGYVMRGGAKHRYTGDDAVAFEVSRLFGVCVQFIDSAGEHEIRSLGYRALEAWCEDPEARSRTHGSEVWLAGLDPLLYRPPANMIFYVYESDMEVDSVGPIRLTYEIAGYAAGVERFAAGFVGKGTPTVVIPLHSVVSGRGSIEVVFPTLTPDDDAHRMRQIPVGSLDLTHESGAEWSFPVFGMVDGRTVVHDVPLGRYLVRYKSPAFLYPPRTESPAELEVVEEGCRFEVPLEGTGWIRLALRDSKGNAYRGKAQVMVYYGRLQEDDDGRFVASGAIARGTRPPYMFEGLRPGPYTLMLLDPMFRGDSGTRVIEVEVLSGQETIASASLER